jgi:hypothetical protein
MNIENESVGAQSEMFEDSAFFIQSYSKPDRSRKDIIS